MIKCMDNEVNDWELGEGREGKGGGAGERGKDKGSS